MLWSVIQCRGLLFQCRGLLLALHNVFLDIVQLYSFSTCSANQEHLFCFFNVVEDAPEFCFLFAVFDFVIDFLICKLLILFYFLVSFKILARLIRSYVLSSDAILVCPPVTVGRIKHDSLARVTLPDAFT
jgi:hypothetical protein